MREIKEIKGMIKNKKGIGAMMMAGFLLFIAISATCLIAMAMIISNIESIGKAVLYIGIAIAAVIGVSALAKRYTLGKEVR